MRKHLTPNNALEPTVKLLWSCVWPRQNGRWPGRLNSAVRHQSKCASGLEASPPARSPESTKEHPREFRANQHAAHARASPATACGFVGGRSLGPNHVADSGVVPLLVNLVN